MDKELNELEAKKTFRLVPRSKAKGNEIVDVMWIFMRKYASPMEQSHDTRPNW